MVIPIYKVTATEAIVTNLKERIQKGEFGPGDRLPSEQFLLQEYQVSRLTLREALAKLSASGIIQVYQGKGAFVKSMISVEALDNVLIPMFPGRNLNRMKELEEARSLIESELAARAAEKRTEKQVAWLKSLLIYDDELMENPEVYAERDYQFHLALAEVADNQFFLAMYQALYQQIRFFLVQYARSIKDRKVALERHRPILKAIIDQDIEKARSLARDHSGICSSYVKKMIINNGAS
ncbi:MAG: FadR family transcriptional regulator [Deltaproteobacteria bacterium]|nr:FadR family transcriptional regulator [Deltaproteobacteria bacterium]MBT4644046.1 FadR family transcriptional regulator [Deltaproteobacteria bacterium]MBT6503655.1 FadR family transcriptional regulator [Deltaproteobacteria bacterium]MBT6612929.1 FadR family transcriptional regulator [Deltaproteobacteria bacterium]MBT7152690.1 FadR family transcriptional regulator [Deltaproteobacteria bacterium]